VNGALVKRVVQDHPEIDDSSFESAGSIVFLSHIGAIDVEVDAAFPRLPYSKEHFIFEPASILGNNLNGEEVAFSGLLASSDRQVRDDVREQLGEHPSAVVEDADVTLMVETEREILGAPASGKSASKAVMAKSDVDAERLCRPFAFRWPCERGGIGAKVFEVVNRAAVFELVPIHSRPV
jgi:hypothetical protein